MAEVSVMLLAADGPPFVTEMVKVALDPSGTRGAETTCPNRKSAVAAKDGRDRSRKIRPASPAEKDALEQARSFAS
jgi:hypothetical protein